jgi:glycine cleavage system aminomethyltransferase T
VAAWLLAARPDENTIRLFGPPETEERDFDWLWRHLPADTRLSNRTMTEGALLLIGPEAPSRIAGVPNPGHASTVTWGMHKAFAVRGTALGMDGCLLVAPLERLHALHAHGRALGLPAVGARALDTLRLWNGVPRRGLDIDTATTALGSPIAGFIDGDKPDFIGRAAVLTERATGPARRLVRLAVDGDDPPCENDTVFAGEEALGLVGSAAPAPETGRAFAFATIPAAHATEKTLLTVEILGQRRPARVMGPPVRPLLEAAQ